MHCDVTIPRMWKARPSQTRSRHWSYVVSHCTEVTRERQTAPGWTTEQGKAFALGSGRITCQNPDVPSIRYKPQFEHLTKPFFTNSPYTTLQPHSVLQHLNTPTAAGLFAQTRAATELTLGSKSSVRAGPKHIQEAAKTCILAQRDETDLRAGRAV